MPAMVPASPRRRPDPTEQRSRGDAGGVKPALQRAHRRGCRPATRALPVVLREGQGDAQPMLGGLEIADPDPDQQGAAKRVCEAEQQQRPVAQPVVARILRRMPIFAASLGFGPRPACLASRSCPAKVSATAAVVVGGGAAGEVVRRRRTQPAGRRKTAGGQHAAAAGRRVATCEGGSVGRASGQGGAAQRTKHTRRSGRRDAYCPTWRGGRLTAFFANSYGTRKPSFAGVADHLASWRTDRHSGRAGAPGPGNAPFARVFGAVLGRLWRERRPKNWANPARRCDLFGASSWRLCLPRLSRCCPNWRKPRESLRFASHAPSRPAHGHRLVRERRGKVRGQGDQSIPDDRSPRRD